MAQKKQKISKQAAAVKTSHITFTISETLEIIREPGNVTNQTVIMTANKTGLMTIYGIKKEKEKTTCKNLGQ
jgi:hypothetical protein